MTVERRGGRGLLLRAAVVVLGPALLYAAVRPAVSSDAVGLAIAGALPLLYAIVLALWRRRMDALAVLSGLGYGLGCLGSVLSGGTALPLKLHEAGFTFALGVVLLVAILIRRPLPLGRLLRLNQPSPAQDTTLGVLVGGFLILHALVHVVLAVTLPTASYLVVSRIVGWGTIVVGAGCLSLYLRGQRRPA